MWKSCVNIKELSFWRIIEIFINSYGIHLRRHIHTNRHIHVYVNNYLTIRVNRPGSQGPITLQSYTLVQVPVEPIDNPNPHISNSRHWQIWAWHETRPLSPNSTRVHLSPSPVLRIQTVTMDQMGRAPTQCLGFKSLIWINSCLGIQACLVIHNFKTDTRMWVYMYTRWTHKMRKRIYNFIFGWDRAHQQKWPLTDWAFWNRAASSGMQGGPSWTRTWTLQSSNDPHLCLGRYTLNLADSQPYPVHWQPYFQKSGQLIWTEKHPSIPPYSHSRKPSAVEV